MMQGSLANSGQAIDLSPEQAKQVRHILASVLIGTENQARPAPVPKVWIFGPQATGRARPYSVLLRP